MIVMPLFWDQYDNAQRVHELGFGQRLDTYGFADEELTAAWPPRPRSSAADRAPTAPPT
jgi:hypothetical protein